MVESKTNRRAFLLLSVINIQAHLAVALRQFGRLQNPDMVCIGVPDFADRPLEQIKCSSSD